MARKLGVAFGVALVCLLAPACSDAREGQLSEEPTTAPESPGVGLGVGGSGARLSRDGAISAAKAHAQHLIQDAEVLSADVSEPTIGNDEVVGGDPGTQGADAVWVVKLTGLFREPPGPPPAPGDVVLPVEPTCSVITVLVDDSTGNYLQLTFERSSAC
jgi:hypothetical protein